MNLVRNEKFWLIVAVGLVCSTAYFVYAGNEKGIFASIVLGVCAWFFSLRTETKNRLDAQGISSKRRVARREDAD